MMNSAITWLRAVLFFSLVFMSLLHLVACTSDTNTLSVTSSSADNRTDQFVAGLKANGHVVQGGSMPISDIAYYNNYNVTDSAGGFNYGVPYKRLQVPDYSATEVENQQTKTSGIFRLQPYEAVVYVGLTPPSGDYFSFTPFLWSRLAGKISNKGDWIFAALGDPLNNTQIKVEGGGKDPFQKNTIVIFTADQVVNDRIVAQAKAAGYPESMINTYIFPSKLLSMGVNPDLDDTFLILVRAANVFNAKSLSDYNNNDNYARVFRVTPTSGNIPNPLKPYDTPPMATRAAQPEQNLVTTQKSLTDSLKDLQQAIIAKTSYLQYKTYLSTRWFAESRDVLLENNRNSPNYHKFVAGEASDTPYLRSSSGDVAANFTLGADDMVIVYGINHAATGLSIYSSFAVYGEKILSPCPDDSIFPKYTFGCGDPIWGGVAGMGNRDSKDSLYGKNNYTGSANYYIPDDPNKNYLYAVRVLRQAPSDPERKPWIVVPEPTAEGGPASGIALADPLFIGYRAYVSKITGHGPDYGDIIPDQAIWFKMR